MPSKNIKKVKKSLPHVISYTKKDPANPTTEKTFKIKIDSDKFDKPTLNAEPTVLTPNTKKSVSREKSADYLTPEAVVAILDRLNNHSSPRSILWKKANPSPRKFDKETFVVKDAESLNKLCTLVKKFPKEYNAVYIQYIPVDHRPVHEHQLDESKSSLSTRKHSVSFNKLIGCISCLPLDIEIFLDPQVNQIILEGMQEEIAKRNHPQLRVSSSKKIDPFAFNGILHTGNSPTTLNRYSFLTKYSDKKYDQKTSELKKEINKAKQDYAKQALAEIEVKPVTDLHNNDTISKSAQHSPISSRVKKKNVSKNLPLNEKEKYISGKNAAVLPVDWFSKDTANNPRPTRREMGLPAASNSHEMETRKKASRKQDPNNNNNTINGNQTPENSRNNLRK